MKLFIKLTNKRGIYVDDDTNADIIQQFCRSKTWMILAKDNNPRWAENNHPITNGYVYLNKQHVMYIKEALEDEIEDSIDTQDCGWKEIR